MLTLTFLGTGTSTGVPMIGCDCPVCQSLDIRDKRFRSSVIVQSPTHTILVDAGPDFRSQALRFGLQHLDAALITHPHTDHIMGFDDLRRFTFGEHDTLNVYADPSTMAQLRSTFFYAFNGQNSYAGYLKPTAIEVSAPFMIGDTKITPLPVIHGRVYAQGYLFQHGEGPRLAYLPDVKSIPAETMALLDGVEVLVVDCLREREHPTHFCRPEALAAAAAMRAEQVWLTHISHEFGHEQLSALIPPHVTVAWDTAEIRLG